MVSDKTSTESGDSSEPTTDELKVLRHLSRAVDDLLEESLKARENLAQTFRRCFPVILSLTGARAMAITTQNEELEEESYSEGEFGAEAGKLLADKPWGIHKMGSATLVSQSLDVVGQKVGTLAILFEGDHTEIKAGRRVARIVEAVAEEFDTVLASVHTAAEKHQLILKFNELLSNPVFELGMDQAVLTLAERVKMPGFILVYRDAVRPNVLHYRTYRNGHLEYESGGSQPFPQMEAAIKQHGRALVSRSGNLLRESLSNLRTAEAVLISGVQGSDPLGKILVWSTSDGFSAYVMDLVRILASVLTQRLVDYNRERIHLSQFFAAEVIDELIEDPDYHHRYLMPRDEEVGLLFADINGFTRICEQVLEAPTRIGNFVDRWSIGVVDIIWKHGGVFDKMVGDCVIGLFGPPFFRSSRLERAEAAVKAAEEIQAFTEKMSSDPEVARIAERVNLPGLGVAIGVNVANTFCGLFGPNQNYTGFSTGMNQTARLQSLGQFRETLVMKSAMEALESSKDPFIKAMNYGTLSETTVKNVSQPLRYAAVIRHQK